MMSLNFAWVRSGGVTQMDSFLTRFFPEVLRGVREARRLLQVRQPAADGVLVAGGEPRDAAGGAAGHHAGRRRPVPPRLRHQRRRRERRHAHRRPAAAWVRRGIHHAGRAAVPRRDVAGAVEGGLHGGVPLLPVRRHGGAERGELLHEPDPGLGVEGVPGGRSRAGADHRRRRLVRAGLAQQPDAAREDEEARASLQRIRGADADVEAEFKEIAAGAAARGRRAEAAARQRIPALRGDHGGHPSLLRLHGLHRHLHLRARAVPHGRVQQRQGAAGLRHHQHVRGGPVRPQVALSWILADHIGTTTMASKYAEAVVALMCFYTFGLGMSWGPLKWVVWGEINPLDVRSVAQAITLSVTFILSFVQSSSSTPHGCRHDRLRRLLGNNFYCV
jgi:hypothetical protein